jgi:heme-degrading monooxygenase HmoA
LKIARNLHCHLKEGKQKEFVQLIEGEILSMLREQAGFQDELVLINRNRALVISFWDDRKHAQAYQTSTFPKVVQTLNPLVETPPHAETFDVATSTLARAA